MHLAAGYATQVLHVIEAELLASETPVGPAASPNWWAAAGKDQRADVKAI